MTSVLADLLPVPQGLLLGMAFLDHELVVGVHLHSLVNARSLVFVIKTVVDEDSADVSVVKDSVALADAGDHGNACLFVTVIDEGSRAPRSHGDAGSKVVGILHGGQWAFACKVGHVWHNAQDILDLGIGVVSANNERLGAFGSLLGHQTVDLHVNLSLRGISGRAEVTVTGGLPLVATGII